MKVYIFAKKDVSSSEFFSKYTRRLELILEKPNSTIFLNDFNTLSFYTGRYLKQHHYRNVVIYHLGSKPRVNFGGWTTKGGFKNEVSCIKKMKRDARKSSDLKG